MTVEYREDASLTRSEDAILRRLLFSCFPHEPLFLVRRYLKERPAHRWLICDGKGEFVAHAAVHDKTAGSASGDIRIGGIAEVCVSAKYRGRGFARKMLTAVHAWLPAHGIPFAFLFGKPEIYSGYHLVENELRYEALWNPWRGQPMVKCLTGTPWPAGWIDLRGGAF